MSSWRLSLVLLTLVSTGCQSLDLSDRFSLKRRIPWKRDEKEIRQGVPTRIVATWTDAVLHKPGQAERGFGGRLYFYDNKGGDPIEVEGQLVVYAFDETGRDPTDNRPNRRFVFPPGQFETHKSESDLGVSYSIWLPWDAAQGGPPAEISLIARFEPVGKGNLITSDQTRQRLPGQGAPIGDGPALANEPATPGVQQAMVTHSTLEPERKTVNQINYETPVAQITRADEAATRMTTTTISLPSKFRRQGATATVFGGEESAEPKMPAPAPVGAAPGGPLPNAQTAADINVVGTQVSYLTAEQSVRRSLEGRTFGSPPASPPAPATPVSR
ncbi:MAG: hypothetical protein WD851_08915 [Pirellulales bacterium]